MADKEKDYSPEALSFARKMLRILRQEKVKETFSSSGGRPTDPAWTEKPSVGMSEQTVKLLKLLATAAGVGHTQLAARLLEKVIDEATAQSIKGRKPKPAKPIPEFYEKLMASVRTSRGGASVLEGLAKFSESDWIDLFEAITEPSLLEPAKMEMRWSDGDLTDFILHLVGVAQSSENAETAFVSADTAADKALEDSHKISQVAQRVKANSRARTRLNFAQYPIPCSPHEERVPNSVYPRLGFKLRPLPNLECYFNSIGIFDADLGRWALKSNLGTHHGIEFKDETASSDLAGLARNLLVKKGLTENQKDRSWILAGTPEPTAKEILPIAITNIFKGYRIVTGHWKNAPPISQDSWDYFWKGWPSLAEKELPESLPKFDGKDNPLTSFLRCYIFMLAAETRVLCYDRYAEDFLSSLSEFAISLGRAVKLEHELDKLQPSGYTPDDAEKASYEDFVEQYLSDQKVQFAVTTGNVIAKKSSNLFLDHKAVLETALKIRSYEPDDHLATDGLGREAYNAAVELRRSAGLPQMLVGSPPSLLMRDVKREEVVEYLKKNEWEFDSFSEMYRANTERYFTSSQRRQQQEKIQQAKAETVLDDILTPGFATVSSGKPKIAGLVFDLERIYQFAMYAVDQFCISESEFHTFCQEALPDSVSLSDISRAFNLSYSYSRPDQMSSKYFVTNEYKISEACLARWLHILYEHRISEYETLRENVVDLQGALRDDGDTELLNEVVDALSVATKMRELQLLRTAIEVLDSILHPPTADVEHTLSASAESERIQNTNPIQSTTK